MTIEQDEQPFEGPLAEGNSRPNALLLAGIAAVIVLIHLITNTRYGFHRDELQFLSDARHLDWGFVIYPPLTPLFGRISLSLFGLSLVGVRLFPVLAQAATIVLTGLMTGQLGGKRLAQCVAALAIALSASTLHYGTQLIYSSFDYLWWVLASYFIIRLLKSENPRWWLAIGTTLGVGLMTKYTILFFICGILGGLVITPARRYLRSGWFWAGVTIACLIVLPNALWQLQHQFISAHGLHSIHIRDLELGRQNGFLRDQFLLCVNLVAAPIWLAGLVTLFRNQDYRSYRLLAWMYLIPLALFMLAKGRGYYLAPAYPMLVAMGAVTCERWFSSLAQARKRLVKAIFFPCLVTYGLICAVSFLPWAPSGNLRDRVLALNWDLREEIGWDDLVKTTAGIRDSLPPTSTSAGRQDIGILTGNYGEAGAIENLGIAYHLPPPITGANSGWLRGYPQPAPSTLIVIGYQKAAADGWFSSCRLAGQITNSYGVRNEEILKRPDIFVCGPPRQPWPQFWKQFKSFQ